MIKKIAWETFKNTGNINSFMELKQIEDIERKIEKTMTQKIDNFNEKTAKNVVSKDNSRYH